MTAMGVCGPTDARLLNMATSADPRTLERAAPKAAATSIVRPLRILTIAAGPLPTRRGTPVRVERLAEALAARGHAVTGHIGEPTTGFAQTLRRIERAARPGDLPPGPTTAELSACDPRLCMADRRSLAERQVDVVDADHGEGTRITSRR